MHYNRQLAPQAYVFQAFGALGGGKSHRISGPLSSHILSLVPLGSLGCTKRMLRRSDGSAFRICVCKSAHSAGKRIGVLWLHGGGYALGGPELIGMSFARHLIQQCNCVVVSPDYTLSPIKPYPAALEDAYEALMWMKRYQKQLGIDCDTFVVGGESAGGGLCAALCMYARDRGENCIAFQMPLYPMLDDRPTATNTDNPAPVWSTKSNRAAWRTYLGDRAEHAQVSVYAAPARQEDFSHLPPAISIVGDSEVFYAETREFFHALNQSHVPCALRVYKGVFHAFDMLAPYADISKDASAYLLARYREFCERFVCFANPTN